MPADIISDLLDAAGDWLLPVAASLVIVALFLLEQRRLRRTLDRAARAEKARDRPAADLDGIRREMRRFADQPRTAEAATPFAAAEPAVPSAKAGDEERLRFLADMESLLIRLPAMRDAATVEKLRRENAELGRRLAAENRPLGELRTECLRLAALAGESSARAAEDERAALYAAMEQVLIQGPSLCRAVEAGGPAPSGRDFAGLLRLVFQGFERLGFERIGEPGGRAAFDPRLHEASGGWWRPLKAGDPVRVVFVGYVRGGQIVRRAQVAPRGDDD